MRTGWERPEDTPDADYDRLLAAATMRKGSCARQDSSLRPTARRPVVRSVINRRLSLGAAEIQHNVEIWREIASFQPMAMTRR